MSDNINSDHNQSGLLTSIWGSDTWNSLHCMSFGYPDRPTELEKLHYKTYFETLKYVLPCCNCRRHYAEHTKQGAKHEITDNIFESRASLTKWVYDLHNGVDESLEMQYDITYDDVCNKYGSYIAECNMSQEKKLIAYKNSYDREAPVISYEMASCFIDYAVKRGMPNFADVLKQTQKNFKNKRIANNGDNWIQRNETCWEIVKSMRTTGILGFEQDGEYKNLPTLKELKLIVLMSTTLKQKSLKHMIKKMGYDFTDKYVMSPHE